MSDLWLPPGAPVRKRAELPARDIALADGRRLLRQALPRPIPATAAAGAWTCADGLKVIASMDETPHGTLLHVSISYADRDPSWTDIRQVRDAFFPQSVDTMMVLPRAEDYVNCHEHCFHLWQTPVVWGLQ